MIGAGVFLLWRTGVGALVFLPLIEGGTARVELWCGAGVDRIWAYSQNPLGRGEGRDPKNFYT